MKDKQQQQASLQLLAVKLNNLGMTFYADGQHNESLKMFEEASSALAASMSEQKTTHERALRQSTDSIALGEKTLSLRKKSKTPNSENDQDEIGSASASNSTRMLTLPLHFNSSKFTSFNDRYNLSVTLFNMGLVHYRRKSYHTAEQLFLLSVKSLPRECYDVGPVAYTAMNSLGHIAYMLENYDEATRLFSESLHMVSRVATRVGIRSHPHAPNTIERDHVVILTNHAVVLFFIAQACETNQMPNEAMSFYTRITNTHEATQNLHQFGLHATDTAYSLVYSLVCYRIGSIHYCRDEIRQAIHSFELSRELRKEALGKDHEDIETLTHDIAVMQYKAGRLDDAMHSFEECLEMRQLLHGTNSVEVAEVLYQIGGIHQQRYEYDEALAFYTRTMRVEELALGPHHPDVAVTLTKIGQCFFSLGKLGQALDTYKKVLAVIRIATAGNHSSIAEIHNTIGTIHMSMGHGLEAAKAFAEARRLENLVLSQQEEQHQEQLMCSSQETTITACAPAA